MSESTRAVATVLASRPASDPRARWELRIDDRGRMRLWCVVEPGATRVIIEALTALELQQFLADTPTDEPGGWICPECLERNASDRHWCQRCSSHARAGDR